MRVGIVIVLFKTSVQEVERLKKEIKNIGFKNYKVYFVDNTKDNQGYAYGANKGIKEALIDNCQLLIAANPDISLAGIKSQELIGGGRCFDVWGLAMRQNRKTYYGGTFDRWRMSGGLIEKKPKEKFKKVDFVSGSLMIIKRKVIDKIGFFDEKYFMYYEDADFCLRVRKAGFKVGIDSKNIYNHFETSKKNKEKNFYLAKNRLKFLEKYGNIWQKIYEKLRMTKGNFIINYLSLNISSVVDRILQFILFLVLIRYFQPEEYGIYSLVWAQALLLSPIGDLGTTAYGLVHLPTEKKQKFESLFNMRTAVSFVIFLVTIGTTFLLFGAKKNIFIYIFLTSFAIFTNSFSGTYLIQNAVGEKLYKSSLVGSISSTFRVLGIILSLIFFKSLGILFSFIFIFYNLSSLIYFFLIKKSLKNYVFSFDLRAWFDLIKKSYIYVLIGFLAKLYFKLDVFLLQFLKGPKEVGIYSAGYKFFEAFMFLAASYNITSTPVFAKLLKSSRGQFFKKMKIDIIFLLSIGLVTVLTVYFLSPIILPILIKKNYTASIPIVKIVIFALPLILVSSVFLNVLYVMGKAYLVIFLFFLQVLINFSLNFIFIPKYSYFASSYITVINEIINLVLLVGIFLIVKKQKHENFN